MLEREKDEAMRERYLWSAHLGKGKAHIRLACQTEKRAARQRCQENTTGWKAEHRGEGRRLSGAEKAAKRIDVKAE